VRSKVHDTSTTNTSTTNTAPAHSLATETKTNTPTSCSYACFAYSCTANTSTTWTRSCHGFDLGRTHEGSSRVCEGVQFHAGNGLQHAIDGV
jgi:hypothetical protein